MSKMTLKTEGDTHVIVTRPLCRATTGRLPRPY